MLTLPGRVEKPLALKLKIFLQISCLDGAETSLPLRDLSLVALRSGKSNKISTNAF